MPRQCSNCKAVYEGENPFCYECGSPTQPIPKVDHLEKKKESSNPSRIITDTTIEKEPSRATIPETPDYARLSSFMTETNRQLLLIEEKTSQFAKDERILNALARRVMELEEDFKLLNAEVKTLRDELKKTLHREK